MVAETEKLNPMEIAGIDPACCTDYVIKFFKKKFDLEIAIPVEVINITNMGWDFFKTAFTSIEEYREIRRLTSLNRRFQEKAARLVFNAALKDLNNTSRIVSVLSVAGVMTGGLATAASISFAIAAASWGIAALSCARLHRAIKKCDDPAFWMKDTLDMYKNVQNKIDLYLEKLNQLHEERKDIKENTLDFKKLEKIEKKIKKLEIKNYDLIIKAEKLKYKAIAIAKVKGIEDPNLLTSFKEIINVENISKKTEADEKLVEELEKNQRETTISRAMTTIGLVSAAIGVTLLSVSPFLGPAAPAVMFAGIAFVGLGLAVDLAPKLVTNIVNFFGKKHHRRDLLNKMNLNHNMLNKLFTLDEKFQFRCSFEINKEKFMNHFDNTDIRTSNQSDDEKEKKLEERWYKSVCFMEKKSMAYLLQEAEEARIKQFILEKNLDPKNSEVINHLSDKDKERIINRENRLVVVNDIKDKFKNIKSLFFSNKKKDDINANIISHPNPIKPSK